MIRKRREKFPLELKDGAKVMTMDELRLYFDLEKILNCLENGQLENFLRDRFYADEADAVKNLSVNNKATPKKLCEILGVNYENFADTAEEIFWRKERLDCLKKFTNDAEILGHVDDVAFNQDDLEDILSQEKIPATVYLCNEVFKFPSGILRIKNIRYVGVGKKVTIVIESNGEINFDALKISFENIELDNKDYSKQEKIEIKSKKISANTNGLKSGNSATTTIKNRAGVYDRPACMIVQNACKFKSVIWIEAKGKKVDAKSILMIMSLGLTFGNEVTISAGGVDAKEAVKTLIDIIDNKFGED